MTIQSELEYNVAIMLLDTVNLENEVSKAIQIAARLHAGTFRDRYVTFATTEQQLLSDYLKDLKNAVAAYEGRSTPILLSKLFINSIFNNGR